MAGKGLYVLAFAAFISGSAFAFDMSAGFGGNFAASFDSYRYDGKDWGSQSIIGGGFFAFFDATFMEANTGMLFGRIQERNTGDLDDYTGNISYFTIGLFGKYPVNINGFNFFPMLGIQLDLGLSGNLYRSDDIWLYYSEQADFMNRFWVKFGAGADFNRSERVFHRLIFLYGINFGYQDDRDLKKADRDFASFHHGLDVRTSVGFRF